MTNQSNTFGIARYGLHQNRDVYFTKLVDERQLRTLAQGWLKDFKHPTRSRPLVINTAGGMLITFKKLADSYEFTVSRPVGTKLFTDYLVPARYPDPEDIYVVEILSEIKELEENPYQEPGTKNRAFVLELSSRSHLIEEYPDDSDEDWEEGTKSYRSYYSVPIKFYYSGDEVPTMEQFSAHIYKECRAAFYALPGRACLNYNFTNSRDEIDHRQVWQYIRLIQKDSLYFRNTSQFVEDYDYWHDRLYATQKWLGYMAGTLEWQGDEIVIGDRIFEFLDIDVSKYARA